jgi:uncharacterized protein (DUF924 family)
MSAAADIVAFWREAGPKEWLGGGAEFDRACDERFRDAHFAAAAPSSMIGWHVRRWTTDVDTLAAR